MRKIRISCVFLVLCLLGCSAARSNDYACLRVERVGADELVLMIVDCELDDDADESGQTWIEVEEPSIAIR